MTTFHLSSLRKAFPTVCFLFVVACQSVNTQDISPRAVSLLAVVENQSGCAIPLERTQEVFSAAGFSSAQERIDLIWNLKTQMGALSVFDRRLLANTEKCGRPPSYLSADISRFRSVQDFFLERDCTTTPTQIKQAFETSDIGPSEFGTYLQILFAAGALELDGGNIFRKDWSGCASL